MPLYIDVHELDEFPSIEEIKQAHLLDVAVQEKYDVRYVSYYVNASARKVFCVVEAPDKESCIAVHKEAHGLMACNIVQVEGGYYDLFMGRFSAMEDGLNLDKDGKIDSAIRTVLLIRKVDVALTDHIAISQSSEFQEAYSSQMKEAFHRYGGREIVRGRSEIITAFISCQNALQCALFLQDRISGLNEKLRSESIHFETIMVLNSGDPVTRSSEFFGDTLLLARRLAHLGNDGDLILSSEVVECTRLDEGTNHALKTTTPEDERFVTRLMEIMEKKVGAEGFTIRILCSRLGISTSQLYRRIHNLFGKTPNQLIHEIRLKEAVILINKKHSNISQIAFQVGYNNPSYFSKCFQERFGVLPSKYNVPHSV